MSEQPPEEAGAEIRRTVFHGMLIVACENGVYFREKGCWKKVVVDVPEKVRVLQTNYYLSRA